MDIVEFPITIPNQPKVDKIIFTFGWVSVVASLAVGLGANSLEYVLFTFAGIFVLTSLIIGINWPFLQSEKSIDWLQVKI